MKLVYSISKGEIESYQFIKETRCYYVIDYNGHIDKVPINGHSNKLGGVVYTSDILKASIEAQRQINIIYNYIGNLQVKLYKAEQSLSEFNKEHTKEEDETI